MRRLRLLPLAAVLMLALAGGAALRVGAPAARDILPVLDGVEPGRELRAAQDAARRQGLVLDTAAVPLPGGAVALVARPAGDACSPAAAWLLCPGLRIVAERADGHARILGAWRTRLLTAPRPVAEVRAAAEARWGRPTRVEEASERARGRELDLLVLGWAATPARPVAVELVLVLRDGQAVTLGLALLPGPGAVAAELVPALAPPGGLPARHGT